MDNINKVVKERCNLLEESNKTLEAIYTIMFKDKDYVLGERNDGYKIYYYSYGDVEKRINEIAYSINIAYPNLKDEYIGIAIDSSIEWVEVFWGILKSGNKPYLINLRHTTPLVNSLLKSLEIEYVIGLKDLGYNAKFIDVISLNNNPVDNYVYTFGNEIALSTSATTLKEKIVFYNGSEISAQILNCKGILKKNKQIKKHYKGKLKQLVFLPLYHIFGFMATYMWFSYFARTLVFLADLSSNTILRTIKKHEVTHIFSVPLFWNTIEKEILKGVRDKGEKTQRKFEKGQKICLKLQSIFPKLGLTLSKKIMKEVTESLFGKSVLFCISGGSYIKDSTVRLINSLGYPLHNGYGMTEIGITSVELGNVKNRLKNSIGLPFDSLDYKIEDNTLYVKGSSISHKMKINGEIVENNDWFKTNDIVRVDDDGRYYIEGRLDDLYIGANGENINPDMIEKEFFIPKAIRYSILPIENKLALVIEVSEYLPKNTVKAIYEAALEINNKLDTSLRVQQIYITFDPIANENAIKVSRQYLTNRYNQGLIKLKTIDEIVQQANSDIEVDEGVLNTVIDIFKDVLGKDNVEAYSNFFFDLEGSSLDYFDMISKVNDKFDIKLIFNNDKVCHTPVEIAIEIERLLSL